MSLAFDLATFFLFYEMNSTWDCKKIPGNHNSILLCWLGQIHYTLQCRWEIWRWKCCIKVDNDYSTEIGKLPFLWTCLGRIVSILNCSGSWPCPTCPLCLSARKSNGKNWLLKQHPSETYVSRGKMCLTLGHVYHDNIILHLFFYLRASL